MRRHTIQAAVMAALYSTTTLADNAADSDGAGLQEVIVTASHREVSAQDLPISISAVTGAQLASQGIQDMAALAHSMAGVSYTDKGPFGGVNGANLIIRGLNSETTSGLPAAASPVVPRAARGRSRRRQFLRRVSFEQTKTVTLFFVISRRVCWTGLTRTSLTFELLLIFTNL